MRVNQIELVTQRGLTGCVQGAVASTDEVVISLERMNTIESIDAVIPRSEAERRALWDIRENFEAMLADRTTFLYDVSLPVREMAHYADAVRERVLSRWPAGRCIQFGHIADGNLHLFIQPANDDCDHRASDEAVYGPLLEIGGSVSAEHGIGVEKKEWLVRSRTAAELDLMRAVKRALDPKNLLNPGLTESSSVVFGSALSGDFYEER